LTDLGVVLAPEAGKVIPKALMALRIALGWDEVLGRLGRREAPYGRGAAGAARWTVHCSDRIWLLRLNSGCLIQVA